MKETLLRLGQLQFSGLAAGKVREPRRIERMSATAYLDVPDDRNRHGTKEPKSLYGTRGLGFGGKHPVLIPLCVEVLLSYPTRAFLGMPTPGPCP